jgi:DNA invertase Pin-like site-specific DNA recombinase
MKKEINKKEKNDGGRPRGHGLFRVSSSKQKKGTSLDKQKQWAIKRAEELNVELIEDLNIMDGVGGKKFLKKYEKKIVQNITEKNIKYIFFYDWNRFTRKLTLGSDTLDKILSLGCNVVTPSEIIDKSSNLFMAHVQMAFSQHQRDTIVTNGRLGQIARLKEGKYPFSHLPAGIKRDVNEKIYFDHSFKALIQDIYNTYYNTKINFVTISSVCNKKYNKILEKTLSASQIKRILTNPIYIGFVLFEGVRYGKDGDSLIPNPLLIAVTNTLFDNVQKKIKENTKNRRKYETPLKDALSEQIETLGFDVVRNNLDDMIIIRCKNCKSIDLYQLGGDILQGHFVVKYLCKNCNYQFRFPDTKQLKRLTMINPRRCPPCGSADDFTVTQSVLSNYFQVTCNKCIYTWLAPSTDIKIKKLFDQQQDEKI